MSEATSDAVYGVLLALHVLAGFTSLFSSFVAMASKFTQVPHRVHQQSGRVFFWPMNPQAIWMKPQANRCSKSF